MDKEQTAIERLKLASDMSLKIYKQPLIVTTSGGKDSSVCVELAQRAGIPFEVMHNHTTADAPETVYFVRSEFKRLEGMGIKCTVNYPTYKGEPTSMWKLIPQKLMPPYRIMRYCCQVLKEGGGYGRFITTGVRWAESVKRKNTRGVYETFTSDVKNKIILKNDNDEKRMQFETCAVKGQRVCNPIVDWQDRDVWDFLQDSKIPLNPLYSRNYYRVGCIGCPLAAKEERCKEFYEYPKYKTMYINAFDRMIQERNSRGLKTTWKNGEEVFHTWMEDGVLPGQMQFKDLEDDDED